MKNISRLELTSLSSEDKRPVDDYLQKTFDLDDVTIEHLKGGLFQKLTYDRISINDSKIFMIDSTAFNGIQVNKLELINNTITTIANRSFENITVNTFDLKETNIGKIKSGAFANIEIKRKINLFDIKIGNISKHAMNSIRAKSFEKKDVDIEEIDIEAITNVEIEKYGGSWKMTEEGIEINNITIDNLEPGLFQNSNYETISIKNSKIGVITSNTFNNTVIDNLELVNTDIETISNGSFNSIQTKSLTLNGTKIGEIQAGAFTNVTIDKFTVMNSNITKLNKEAFDLKVNVVDDENNTAQINAENIVIMQEIENSFNLCHDPSISCKFKNISIMTDCNCELFKVATSNHVHTDNKTFINEEQKMIFKDIISGFYCHHKERLFQWIIYDIFECEEQHQDYHKIIKALADLMGLGK